MCVDLCNMSLFSERIIELSRVMAAKDKKVNIFLSCMTK